MRRDARDPWSDLLASERRSGEHPHVEEPLFTARRILLVATAGTAGVALAVPVVIAAATFSIGLLQEGVGTLRALLVR